MPTKLTNLEWDRVAEEWNKEAGNKGVWHQQHDIDPVVLKILGNTRGKNILEVGCGNGYFARILAKRGAKVIATDASRKLVELATQKEKIEHLGVTYLIRDAADLYGLRSAKFDAVIANMVFMDVANARKAVKEASRVLKNKGRFIFSLTHPVFCDFQRWEVIKERGKKYFARVVYRYLSSVNEREKISVGEINITVTQYHRSINEYFKYLRGANFLVDEFREITTSKPVTKGDKKYKNVVLQRSKYFTLDEKKIKEFAGRELPLFLVIGALKFK